MNFFLCICERCWNPVNVPDYLRDRKPPFVVHNCKKCRTTEENEKRQKAIDRHMNEKQGSD